jgi:uncharacterized DUF497 family protein
VDYLDAAGGRRNRQVDDGQDCRHPRSGRPDERHEYDEACMVALGYIGLRIMAVVFVDRPPEQATERRIISLRKANPREVKRYAET